MNIDVGQGLIASKAYRHPGGYELLPQGPGESVVIVFFPPKELDAELERGLHRPIKFSGRDAQEPMDKAQ